ncbi:hypothetical protein [Actinomadura gamaensis]|uniref:DUF4288 domain-containing protein n=1 Tax=Actinomadura gamaensis TaxID=1763541 RepID=A0ABV9U6C4_9ACTN
MVDREGWYGVRCLLRWTEETGRPYEESVTVWRAASFDEAIAKAEDAARENAALLGGEYLGLAQAYFIGGEESLSEGVEVFSLVRDSDLDPDAYLSQYFDTGTERQVSES